MYAVIETGSKQYKVQPGDLIFVERLQGDPKASIQFDKVLLVSHEDKLHIGTPFVSGAKVIGEIVSQIRDKKILMHKYKNRKNYHRTKGHRQYLTGLQIKEIKAN